MGVVNRAELRIPVFGENFLLVKKSCGPNSETAVSMLVPLPLPWSKHEDPTLNIGWAKVAFHIGRKEASRYLCNSKSCNVCSRADFLSVFISRLVDVVLPPARQ